MRRIIEEEPVVYIDGNFYSKSEAKISVYDHGLLYGDGVFEGIRAYNGIVFKLKEHIDRLYQSAHTIMLEIPMTKAEMINAVRETLNKNKLRNAYIRLVITRGIGDLGLDPKKCQRPTIIIIAESAMRLVGGKEAKEKGITTLITWVKRDPVDATTHEVKSLNYLNSILAKLDANAVGIEEAIMLSSQGFISEGVGENIFMVRDGKVITPPASAGILEGITRKVIMKLAEKLGYSVIERDITPNELFNADEVFLTGTAAEVLPVREINKRIIGEGIPGPFTKRLIEEFEKIREDPEEGTPIY